MPIPIINGVPFPGLMAAPPPTLAPKWKRRRRRFEARRTRATNRIDWDGVTFVDECRRSPLARALRPGYRQDDPFPLFLERAFRSVYGTDPRARLVGVNGAWRGPVSPWRVDAELLAMGVPRGARCLCGQTLVVVHYMNEFTRRPSARCWICLRPAVTKPWGAP